MIPDSVAEGFLIPKELDAIGSRPSNEVMDGEAVVLVDVSRSKDMASI